MRCSVSRFNVGIGKASGLLGLALLTSLTPGCASRAFDRSSQLNATSVDQKTKDIKLLSVITHDADFSGSNGANYKGKALQFKISDCKTSGSNTDCTEALEASIKDSSVDNYGPMIEKVEFPSSSPPDFSKCKFATVYTASRTNAYKVSEVTGFYTNSSLDKRTFGVKQTYIDAKASFPKNLDNDDMIVHRYTTLYPCDAFVKGKYEIKPNLQFGDSSAPQITVNWDENPSNYQIPEAGKSFCSNVLQNQHCGSFRTLSKPVLKDYGTVTATPPADYAANAAAPANTDLAQVSVLAAMRQIRKALHRNQADGTTDTSPAYDGTGRIDRSDVEGCLLNKPFHWSDVSFHYYCQLGNARNCYSGAVRSGKPRTQAYEDCRSDTTFGWVHANQEKVFKYMMFSQTNAFDWAQQQEVINEYYGDMKPSASGPFDPNDDADCRTYRVLRYDSDPSSGSV